MSLLGPFFPFSLWGLKLLSVLVPPSARIPGSLRALEPATLLMVLNADVRKH